MFDRKTHRSSDLLQSGKLGTAGAVALAVTGLPTLAFAATAHEGSAHGDEHHAAAADGHAGAAHDAGHGGHHKGIDSLVWPTVNFAIYLAVMAHFYKKFAVPALKARAVNFDEQFRKAERALEDAERELRAAHNRFDQIDEEQAAIDARFGAEAQALSREILEAARRSIAQIENDVQRRIESEKVRAFEQLRNEAVARAAKVARDKLRSGLSPEDDYRLRHETLRGLI